jgi:hypothetical protein
MIKFILLFVAILLLTSCSFSKPKNEWRYNSADNFKQYTKYFLSANENLAQNNYARATQNAKKSADLTTLARVYLGKCALNISVGLEDSCQEYKNISEFINSKELDAYYALLTNSLQKEQISSLPSQYQGFARNILDKKYMEASSEVFEMKSTTATLLSASIIRAHLSTLQREEMIKLASFYGYKKAVLFWLRESKKDASEEDKNRIDKKIKILTSKE